MFFYDPKAITYKTINKFSYEFNADLSINLLKYYNDSSAILRIMDALTSATRELSDDMPYMAVFNPRMKNFRQIDRLNKFYVDNIPDMEIDYNDESVTCFTEVTGFSPYTNDTYTMQVVDDKDEFLRHSYPCDIFFIKDIGTTVPISATLQPNIKNRINLKVHSSTITIRPIGPMSEATIGAEPEILLVVEGINIQGELVEERMFINIWTDYNTREEWTLIKTIKLVNSLSAFDIVVYPYINGQKVFWNEIYTDREEFDRYNAIVTFNTATKNIEYSFIQANAISFPTPTQLFKTVSVFGMPSDQGVPDYFIDQDNGLFYALSDDNRLFCYPLIIPKSVSTVIDDRKTAYQSCRIEYFEDCENKRYIFDIFPTSKTNGVDFLDIYINGVLHKEGLVLDLIREKLIDNRIDIMFEDMFEDGPECLIEFKTFGDQDSVFPVFITKSQVLPLFIKSLDANAELGVVDSSYSSPVDTSTRIPYPNPLALNSWGNLYRLSKYGSVVMNGIISAEVYNTFYYNREDNSFITHDTIAGLKGN